MRPVTYSWIGLSAASPLIFLICAWGLGVFHSYRRYWRSVDLFLLAIFVQELLTALLIFIFSLLSLMQPSSGVVCGAFVWSLSATRTLQAATVTSLLVDRALTSQWPYKYRFSVRRHQIRYHLVVLATMAALVGVAALLARPSEGPLLQEGFEECRFLPHSLHVRLALFLLSLYGMLIVISAVSACVVQSTRGCRGAPHHHPDHPQDMAPITHGTTGSSSTSASSVRTPVGRPLHPVASSASTTSSTSSGPIGGGLHSSTTDLMAPPPTRHPHKRGVKVAIKPGPHRVPTADFRWGGCLVVAGICFFVNHLPYIGLLILGTFFPSSLPAWPMENLSLWFSLFEGILLPLGLGLSDPTFGEAAILSCSREQRPLPAKYEDQSEPYRGLPKEEVKSFPLTNGSLFSSLLNMNVQGPLHALPPHIRGKVSATGMRMGTSGHDIRGTTLHEHMPSEPRLGAALGHLFYNPGLANSRQDPIYSDPMNKAMSMDSSLKMSEDDHIYATLSETYGSLSSMSDDYLSDQNRCSSATTDANDDFEYHGPRMNPAGSYTHLDRSRDVEDHQGFVSACNLAIGSRIPTPLPQEEGYLPPPHSPSCNLSSEDSSPSSSFRSCSSTDVCDSLTLERDREVQYDPETIINPRASPRLGFINEAFENDTLEKKHYFDRIKTESLEDISPPQYESRKCFAVEMDMPPSASSDGTLTRKHRSSSLSMNDLDRLDPRESDPEEEMMFILPVKSESMLSLYRLYLAEDEDSGCTNLHYSLEVSKSESDLTVINGKGSYSSANAKHAPVQEIYQKKRVPLSAGSRIRRQHKIQRAKGLQSRNRPVLPVHEENPSKHRHQEVHNQRQNLHERHQNKESKLSVTKKAKRKNGIITIKDPSVLSVEELFKVLNRASVSEKERKLKETTDKPFETSSTEYKKIFVSEYI